MKIAIIAMLLLGSLFINSCQNNPESPLNTTEQSNIDPKTGNLIALWLIENHTNKEEAIIVTKPYAVYMQWYNDTKEFFLYENVRNRTDKTNDFDVFLEYLRKIPEGTAIQRFDSCTVSRLHGVPENQLKKLKSILSNYNLTWATGKAGYDCEIFCICMSSIRYP